MKKIFFILFSILTTVTVFCDSYYVCLGSFTDKKNAVSFVKALRERNVETFIYTVVVPGTTRYRVLLNKPSDRGDDARMFRNTIMNSDYVQELGLTGLWVCFAPEPNGEENYEEPEDSPEVSNDETADLIQTDDVTSDESVDYTEIPCVPEIAEVTDDEIPYPSEENSIIPEYFIETEEHISGDETDEVSVDLPKMKIPSVENVIVPAVKVTFYDMTDDATADTIPELMPVETEETEPIVLAANSRDKMRISAEIPYSVMVRSYKEEQNADSDAKRLCDDDWDAYIVKCYDDETFFSFDVLVSAYKTEEEAAEAVKELEEHGIRDTIIVEYGKMREKSDRYDEVVRTRNITFDKGNGQMPNIMGDYVRRAVEGFPINSLYEIRNITITDNDNLSARLQTSPDNGEFAEWTAEDSHVHAFIVADCYDYLYDKVVKVSIASGNSGDFILDKSAVGVRSTVTAKGDIYNGVKYSTETGWNLVAKNEDGSLMILFTGDNLEQSEFDLFIGSIDDKKDLLSQTQIRKTLCVLPHSEDFNANFLTFDLHKVETDYVKEKESVEWAIPMVGHWRSGALLTKDNDDYSVSFFDLDYDYVAEQTHKLFSAGHKDARITEYNHGVQIGDKEGWYIYNNSSAELSFSTKSYIIAVGTQYHYENDLTDLSSALQVWQ